jgi:hypothetical protein
LPLRIHRRTSEGTPKVQLSETRALAAHGGEVEQAMTRTNDKQRSGQTEDRELKPGDWDRRIICPITRHPCEGDLAYLCSDYGCARKGGLSPRSDENF